jgi:hypothetical protein
MARSRRNTFRNRIEQFWEKLVGKVIIIAGFVAGVATLLGNIDHIQAFFKGLFEEKKGLKAVDVVVVDKDTMVQSGNTKSQSNISDTDKDYIIPPQQSKNEKHYPIGVNAGDNVINIDSGSKRLKTERIVFQDQETIDIKLRNNGTEVLVIKRIEILFKKKWIIYPDEGIDYTELPSTKTYSIVIGGRQDAPYVRTIPVSQVIEPGKADRFTMSLKCILFGDDTYVYLADVKIIYNEDNAEVVKSNLFLAFEKPLQIYKKDDSANIKSINEMRGIKGQRTPTLEGILGKFN